MDISEVPLESHFILDLDDGSTVSAHLLSKDRESYYFVTFFHFVMYVYNQDKGNSIVYKDGDYYKFEGNVKFGKNDIISS